MSQQPAKAPQQDRSKQDSPYSNRSNPANQTSPASQKDEEERKKQAAKNRVGGQDNSESANPQKNKPSAQNAENDSSDE